MDFNPYNLFRKKKNGVTFKGETNDYIEAHQRIFNMMNRKGAKYHVNGREIRMLDNSKTKPIKVEVKPLKGPSGTVNLKIYNVNANRHATLMIQKMRNSELLHVKVFAFKVIKYLLDDDIGKMKQESNGISDDLERECKICGKQFKTVQGLNIHRTKLHKDFLEFKDKEKAEGNCDKCKFVFANQKELKKHATNCGKDRMNFGCNVYGENFQDSDGLDTHDKSVHNKKGYKCDYCDVMMEAASDEEAICVMQKHHEVCTCKSKVSDIRHKFTCDLCDYSSISDDTFKRHKREMHDSTTKSTSPKPKRRRKLSNVEVMETDEVNHGETFNMDEKSSTNG